MGSNNWAISAKRTADGRAIVANDMHLGIRVPHIWYRASFVWPEADGATTDQRITGLTLPGTPAMVVGSNGHIAWGFTNTQADWADVVIVDVDPHDKESYLTPKGPQKFVHHSEKIKVKDAPDAVLDVVDTIWGPVIETDAKNRPRVWRWVAHDTEGVNMGLLKLESARTLEESLRLANLAGAPGQNFVVADEKGRIAWTVMGRLPRRVGFEGRLPSSWADGSHRWDGYLKPEEYPRIIDPADGRIWTANARVVSDDLLARLGDGMYDLGARAQQIRDDLRKLDKANEADMLKIQLDDRAVFLERWRKLLVGYARLRGGRCRPAPGRAAGRRRKLGRPRLDRLGRFPRGPRVSPGARQPAFRCACRTVQEGAAQVFDCRPRSHGGPGLETRFQAARRI